MMVYMGVLLMSGLSGCGVVVFVGPPLMFAPGGYGLASLGLLHTLCPLGVPRATSSKSLMVLPGCFM